MIVLASASRIRRAVLAAAGIAVTVDAAAIDEAAVKRILSRDRATAPEVATRLAEDKATQVSRRHLAQLVIGADQVLDLDGEMFDKPRDRAEAAAQLRRLRNRAHHLHSAVAVARDGEILWRQVDQARLVMRDFSEPFLHDYLDRVGDDAVSSVGAYQLEGLGAQLFSTVDGDFFTIMGLPLLPLLTFLRNNGSVMT